MILAAATSIATRPNIEAPPFASSSHDIEDNSLPINAKAATAADMITICPANLVMVLLLLSIILAAATSMVIIPTIPAPPLAISVQLMDDISLPTKVSTPTAADMIIICPANFVIDLLLPSMTLAAVTSMVTIPNTPAPPLASSSQLIEDSSLATRDRAATAADMTTICPANFVMDLLFVFMSLAAATRIVTNPATPARPLATPSQSRSARTFIAPANIRTAADNPIIETILEILPKLPTIPSNGVVVLLFNLPSIVIAATNSPNSTPIEPKD